MVFVYTVMGVLCVEHANVLELCYIELLSGDGSPYSVLSALSKIYLEILFLSELTDLIIVKKDCVNHQLPIHHVFVS